MWILPLIGYLGLLLGFAFLTLAIASGLYYLSELVEEHTVLSKKLLTSLIYAVIANQTLLALVDSFPWSISALSIASHVIYAQNLRRFPVVKLTDPVFLLSCGKSPFHSLTYLPKSLTRISVLVLLNHYLWFRHFSAPPPRSHNQPYYYSSSSSSGPSSLSSQLPTFTEIAAFFGLQVWLVPFALFISLSAGENVLPSMGSEYATGAGSSFISAGKEPAHAAHQGGPGRVADAYSVPGRRKRAGTSANAGMAKAAVNGVREWIGETGELMGLWKGDNRSRPYL